MKSMLVRSVVVPVITRLGTAFGAYLVAKGLDSDLADQLINGLIAVFLVGCDVFAGRYLSSPKETADVRD